MSLSDEDNSKLENSPTFVKSSKTRDASPNEIKVANLNIKTPQMKSHKVGGSLKMGKTLNVVYSSNVVSSNNNSKLDFDD